MHLNQFGKLILALAICTPALARAEVGIYATASTLGFGGGVGYDITDSISARIGYLMLNFEANIHTEDLDYDGRFKLGGIEGILDWHPFDNGFRFSGGVIFSRNKIHVDGILDQVQNINGVNYTLDQLATIHGNVTFNWITPYVGIGWGRVVGMDGNLHFTADAGLQYYGSPHVKLEGGCTELGWAEAAAINSSVCQQLDPYIQKQESDFNHQVEDYKWYPVVSIGLAYRF